MTKMSMLNLAQLKVAQPNSETFGLKCAIEHWPSGTDARRSAEKPQHEAVALQASLLGESLHYVHWEIQWRA